MKQVRSLIDEKKRARVKEALRKGELDRLLAKKEGRREEAPAQAGSEEQVELNGWLLKSAAIGNKEKIKRLIEAGADVEARGEHGETALMTAALHGHGGAVGELIFAGSANVDATDNYDGTALMAAAANGYKEIVLMLVEAGADLNLSDEDGRTALKRAEQNGHSEIVKFLKGNGAM